MINRWKKPRDIGNETCLPYTSLWFISNEICFSNSMIWLSSFNFQTCSNLTCANVLGSNKGIYCRTPLWYIWLVMDRQTLLLHSCSNAAYGHGQHLDNIQKAWQNIDLKRDWYVLYTRSSCDSQYLHDTASDIANGWSSTSESWDDFVVIVHPIGKYRVNKYNTIFSTWIKSFVNIELQTSYTSWQ